MVPESSHQEREELYRSIFENYIDAYYRADMSGKLILASPSTARMLGYASSDEIIGRDIATTFWAVPEERTYILNEFRTHGKVSGYMVVLKTSDDRNVPVEINARIISNQAGEPLYIEGTFRDMTERVEAERKLRTSELFYRSLFENTGAATVLYDENGLIERCNSKFERLSGLTREQIEDKYHWTEFVDKDDLQRMWSYHQQRVREGQAPPREYDFTFISHDGTRRFVHVTVGVVEESQKRIASLVDITPRKRMEEELAELNASLEKQVEERTQALATKASELEQANQRLLDLDRLKSTIMSTVSHELRTPLTSLLGFTKLLQKNFARHIAPLAATNPEIHDRAEMMRANLAVMSREGERLTRMLNDLLDLARIESGEIRLKDEPLDIVKAAIEAVESAAGEFHHKQDVSLRLEVPEHSIMVMIDKDRLQQVLLNLLNNAAKFTYRGEVVLAMAEHGQGVDVSVTDTGCGIPEDQMSTIFESFHTYRQNDTISSETGTGLGLTICRHILERYGSSITVSSTLGQGSMFVFTLPVLGNKAPAA